MAIVTKTGKKFIQIQFTTGSGELWSMPTPKIIRCVRVTAPPNMLVDGADYITFGEVYGDNPDLFTLDASGKATAFYGNQSTRLGITAYSLTNPTSVVVSIELDED